MREYRFLTTWLVGAPAEPVFEAIWDSERWPEWWPGVAAAELTDPGGPDGVGRAGSYEWRSRIPYPVRFDVVTTRIDRPHLLEGAASGGLEGVGRWRLFESEAAAEGGGPATAVIYEWNVRTTKRWMNLLGPVAAPVFRWNHDHVMAAGGEGLAGLLDAPLLASG